MFRRLSLLVLVVCLSALPLIAQQAGPAFLRDAVEARSFAAAPHLADRPGSEPLMSLPRATEAAADEVEAIHSWNEQQGNPPRNGFTRAMPTILSIRLAPASAKTSPSTGGGTVTLSDRATTIWSGNFRVDAAFRFRLHLTNVSMPAGTTLWIYGASEKPIAFDSDLIDATGGLYTPSVGGDTAYLEVEVPSKTTGTLAFDVHDIVEIIAPAPRLSAQSITGPADEPTCLIDATCVTSTTLDVIDAYRKAVAHLEFMKGGSSFVCSGGLINDTDDSSAIPYFLTANHCFSDQTAATSLEAFWDYRTASCGGGFPDLASLQRSNGAVLKATSAVSDFTFVQLSSIPSGRVLLGWNASTAAVPSGTKLFRISHPFPDAFDVPGPQSYSETFVDTTVGTCSQRPRSNYVYSTGGQGGVYGGSSGSPVILAGGYIVGQLFGSCGPTDPTAGCDRSNSTVDGAFSATFPSISPFLQAGPSTAPCVANATTACVLNNRFKVTVRYRSVFDNNPTDSDAVVKPVTGFGNPNFETAFFYFNSPNNIEMLVKLLDQGNTDTAGRPTIAVLFGSATPLRIELTVVDSTTGASKKYTSEFGKSQGGADFTAFVK
ncbi:MAG: trypsin-like peptidase domain-containing protein [Acidobacteriota bacterium]